MTHDADLIAALRACSHCDSTGNDPDHPAMTCGWCRLDRMAADRIESKNRKLAIALEWAREIDELLKEASK